MLERRRQFRTNFGRVPQGVPDSRSGLIIGDYSLQTAGKTGLYIEAWEPSTVVPRAISRSAESNVGVGIALPQYGTIASPKTILRVAEEAEKMGLASLWVSDRMLLPTKPKETFDGDPWPEIFVTVYDPIEMLTFVTGGRGRLSSARAL
jgi:hypothetical protein